jgi:hypothetical protein
MLTALHSAVDHVDGIAQCDGERGREHDPEDTRLPQRDHQADGHADRGFAPEAHDRIQVDRVVGDTERQRSEKGHEQTRLRRRQAHDERRGDTDAPEIGHRLGVDLQLAGTVDQARAHRDAHRDRGDDQRGDQCDERDHTSTLEATS